jgi:hypothetical protein
MRPLVLRLVLLATIGASGCGDDEVTTPTSPAPSEAAVDAATRLFTGTLSPGAAAFYSFTVTQAAGVKLTLASLTDTSGRRTSVAQLRLGLGVPRGTGCAVTTTVTTGADLAAQINEWRTPGVHCASLADPGVLTADVSFAVRIGYYQ